MAKSPTQIQGEKTEANESSETNDAAVLRQEGAGPSEEKPSHTTDEGPTSTAVENIPLPNASVDDQGSSLDVNPVASDASFQVEAGSLGESEGRSDSPADANLAIDDMPLPDPTAGAAVGNEDVSGMVLGQDKNDLNEIGNISSTSEMDDALDGIDSSSLTDVSVTTGSNTEIGRVLDSILEPGGAVAEFADVDVAPLPDMPSALTTLNDEATDDTSDDSVT